MPTTPTYGLPYPALSDTPNGPSQIGSLATTLDTLFGTFATADTNLTARFTNLLLSNAGFSTVAATESRSNATFGALTTAGPVVNLTSVGTKALVVWGAITWGSAASAAGRMAVQISGATTLAAAAGNGFYSAENTGTGVGNSGVTAALYTINPGANVYTALYNNIAANGTSFWGQRVMFVFAP